MAVAGLILSAIGTGVSVYGQIKGVQAAKDAEAQRKKQMNLDAMRQRREIIRNQNLARATAISTGANTGAFYGSALPGAEGQIAGRAGNQITGSSQNQEIGNNIFAANRRAFDASIISDFGAGMSSLGNGLISNAGTFERVNKVGWF